MRRAAQCLPAVLIVVILLSLSVTMSRQTCFSSVASEAAVAFNDLELASIKRSIANHTKKRGPPAHIQNQLNWD